MRLELGRRMMLVLMRSLPSRVMGIGCRQDGFCWEVCAWKFVVVPKDYIGARTRMTCGSSRHICRPTCGGRAGLAVQGRGAVWCQSREHSRPRFNIRGEGTILGSVVAIGIRKRRDIDFPVSLCRQAATTGAAASLAGHVCSLRHSTSFAASFFSR